jgi:hypothetical protein
MLCSRFSPSFHSGFFLRLAIHLHILSIFKVTVLKFSTYFVSSTWYSLIENFKNIHWAWKYSILCFLIYIIDLYFSTTLLTDTLQHLLYIWKKNCLCQFDMHRILFTYVKSVQSCRHAQEAVLGLRCITSHVDAHCRTGIFCRTGTLCHKSDNCGTLRRTRFGLYPLSYIDAASTTIKKGRKRGWLSQIAEET